VKKNLKWFFVCSFYQYNFFFVVVEKEKVVEKPKALPELDKYWKAVNDDVSDFTAWTYLLQYVDQEVSNHKFSHFLFSCRRF
jgi:hypothetical protein